jgi:chromate reductase
VTKILAIPGSGRKGSYNRALLEAAKELLPENTMFEIFEVANLPLFTQDREKDPQPEVHAFKQKIKEADAILFATPEHNYSISAVLKNAIEWANRLDEDNAWYGKPAAIVSASTGPRGGARAQLHLRQIMVDVKMYPINEPELYLAKAEKAFDANLRLIDEGYRETLKMILQNLVSWSKKLRND